MDGPQSIVTTLFVGLLLVAAPTTRIEVVPRSAWDEARPPSQRARPISARTFIVIHHSDFAESPGPVVIRNYHRQVSGFSDIGYHFVIEPDGMVYEGRAIDRVGAHAGVTREQRRDKTKDPDYDSIGICLDGLYTDALPPAAQLKALVLLLADLRDRYGIPSDHVIGHRDVRPVLVEGRGLTFAGNETECPGAALAEALPLLRVMVPARVPHAQQVAPSFRGPGGPAQAGPGRRTAQRRGRPRHRPSDRATRGR